MEWEALANMDSSLASRANSGFWNTWGPAPGYMEAHKDIQAEQKRGLEIQEKTQELSDAALMKRLAMLAAQGGTSGDDDSMAVPMERLSELMLGGGFWKPAKDASNVASQIRGRETRAVASMSRAAVNELNARRQELELLDSFTSQASDQQSWDDAQALFTATTGAPSPYAGTAFSEGLQREVTSTAMAAKDRLQREATQGEYDSRERNRQSMDAHRKFLQARMKRLDELAKQREKRLRAQAGDKLAGAPSRQEVDATVALVRQQVYPNIRAGDLEPWETSSIANGARAIASRAKQLIRENRGLDWDTAQKRALTEAIQAGDWEVNPSAIKRDKIYYRGAGKTPDTAVSAPEKGKRVQGRYYLGAGGQVAQWTKDGWRATATAPRVNAVGDEDEDDEDDDDLE